MNSDLAKLASDAIGILTKFCVPLYVEIRGRPILIGTGFFVRVEDECFLVSAAHVLDEAKKHRMYFHTSPRLQRELDGRLIRSKSRDSRLGDRIDIGVVRLGPLGRPPYAEVEKYPMDISYLAPKRLPRTGRNYAVIGYPETKNRFRPKHRDILAAPYSYRTESIPETEYSRHGVSAETHVVLPLDLKVGFDSENRPVQFPKPQGMSGSPMVVLYEEDLESRVFPVVAVAIEYRKTDRVLIATDVQCVLEAMRQAG